MLPEFSARAQKCGFDPALAAAKARGQLLDRLAVKVAKNEHAAHLLALCAKKRADARAKLCCGSLALRVGQRNGAVVQLVERESKGIALALLRAFCLIAVERQIARDPAEKGGEDRRTLRRNGLPGVQVGVVHVFLTVGAVG